MCFHKILLSYKVSNQNYFDDKNKNEIMKIENMLSMHAGKTFSRQLFLLFSSSFYT